MDTVIRFFIFLLLFACSRHEAIVVAEDPQPDSPSWWSFFTVDGVDSDKDGVRDDVEIWINEQTQDYNYNQALKQLARTDLESLKITDSLNAQLNLQKLVKDGHCKMFILMNTYPDELKKNPSLSYKLRKMILNNPWRRNRYNEVGKLIPKQFLLVTAKYPAEEFTSCEFQVKGFESLLLRHRKESENNSALVEAIDKFLLENKL